MAIRPVDMQVMMPRMMETSRVNAHENARPMAESQQFAQQMQKNVVQEQQRVISAHRPEGQKVDKDGRGNSGGGGGGRRRRGQNGDDEKEAGQSAKRSLLDMTL